MSANVLATFDQDLTVRRCSAFRAQFLHTCVFDLVPAAHHSALRSARRRLFNRAQLVTCELPTWAADKRRLRWWLVRAVPVSQHGRVVYAMALIQRRVVRQSAPHASTLDVTARLHHELFADLLAFVQSADIADTDWRRQADVLTLDPAGCSPSPAKRSVRPDPAGGS